MAHHVYTRAKRIKEISNVVIHVCERGSQPTGHTYYYTVLVVQIPEVIHCMHAFQYPADSVAMHWLVAKDTAYDASGNAVFCAERHYRWTLHQIAAGRTGKINQG